MGVLPPGGEAAPGRGVGGRGRVMGLAVPPLGPGVCVVCRGPARDGRPQCWCCRQVSAALGPGRGAGPALIPVALCRVGDALHHVLRGYKDAASAAVRQGHARRLAAHLEAFFIQHEVGPEAAGARPWDTVATVPSSTPGARRWDRRPAAAPGSHPLHGVVARVPVLARCRPVGQPRRPGSRGAGHLAPHLGAFVPDGDVSGLRVLVLDDAWVTGARLRSAAAALEDGGAVVVAMVVAGRVVDPGASPGVARWWAWAERCASGADPGAGPSRRRGRGATGPAGPGAVRVR